MTMPTTGRRSFLGAGIATAVLPRRARAQEAGPVRIGVLTDLSGPYADSGGPGSVVAAQMAVKDFGGTVLGKPIEVLAGDTGNKADIAGTVARRWYDEGMDAITDLPVTPIAAAVQQIAREKTRSVMIAAATANELTSKSCTPVSTMWIDDNHALVSATTRAAGKKLNQKWFFITVDYTFGHNLMAEATALIVAAGGSVLGTALFPLGGTDFSSQVVSAGAAGADVIGLIAVGNDQVNLVKQAGEFGLGGDGRVTLAAFNVYITDVKALGLQLARGLTFGAGYYWDALAVNRAMRGTPADRFGKPALVRADGRVLYDIGLYQVKAPAQSNGEWDFYESIGMIAAADAFLPMNPACGPAG